MVETQGYTCQEHKRRLHPRLAQNSEGTAANKTPNKQLPVLLQHGLLMDASAWLLNPPDQALAFILADNGFDVWLANTRGTNSSRGHTLLTPNDPAYWDWSWDELAAYDLPALFEYVNNQTGQKLHYVGHSLGTLTALAAFSQENLLNLLRSAALLGPVAYLGQMSSLFLRILMNIFLAETQQLVKFICKTPGVDCSDLLATITGPNCCLSSAGKATLFKNFPQSTATKNMIHLSQMVRMGTLEMYDYGLEDANMEHYKQPTPPVYNMANIPKDVPLFLSYGGRDAISDVNDGGLLLDNLKDHDKDKLVVEYREDYAHLDFIMSVNANQLVYNPILAFFKLH
ncbi:triacylglycerol lipase 2-like [Pyrus ussuriensis x Pyrus communis]|uniref:Triacylglycerol lipase 2-like n=1 Tax=Pyrus ussuriensis x Pyrus communis TaxID=2448454 RepID=A0A5N5GIS6_9ROSA|nr:triacylglycerol lipase 2-like [Pyrus ussuriensis x Pyrus communis]